MQRAPDLFAAHCTVHRDVLGVEHEDVSSHGILEQGLTTLIAGVHFLLLNLRQAKDGMFSFLVITQGQLPFESGAANITDERGSFFLGVKLFDVIGDLLACTSRERLRTEGAMQRRCLWRAVTRRFNSVHRPHVFF